MIALVILALLVGAAAGVILMGMVAAGRVSAVTFTSFAPPSA